MNTSKLTFEAADRLRRLQRALCFQAILSPSEARSAILAHRMGDVYGGSEAVCHYGGATALLRDTVRHRETIRQALVEMDEAARRRTVRDMLRAMADDPFDDSAYDAMMDDRSMMEGRIVAWENAGEPSVEDV